MATVHLVADRSMLAHQLVYLLPTDGKVDLVVLCRLDGVAVDEDILEAREAGVDSQIAIHKTRIVALD